MEYIVLLIIILIIILLIIQSNSFETTTIKTSPLNLNVKPPTIKTNRFDNLFNTTGGVSGGNNLGKRPKGKDNLLDASVVSSCTVSKEYKGTIGPDVKKDKDYYYLGDPKDTQLYHVFNNVYTYKEAEKTCSDRKSRLASTDELSEALNKGADWCSWGWANDGHAYMPNKNPKCNKDTGLLSAKNIDPFLRLGANCYGVPL